MSIKEEVKMLSLLPFPLKVGFIYSLILKLNIFLIAGNTVFPVAEEQSVC